jgi:hypothetical protein
MKKDKTILEYCSACDEELEMPVVQRDANNPHLVWVRCPKCNETKPVDIMASAEDIHEESPVVESEEAEAYFDDEELEDEVGLGVKKVMPLPEPPKKPSKKKAGKLKGKGKDKKALEPEAEYKIDKEKSRDYSPTESYKPGETIFHKAWKQYGVVLRVRRSGGGRDLIEVRFDKNQLKKLLVNQKPAG